MFKNRLNPLCALITTFFFAGSLVFVGQSPAAFKQSQNKKDETKKEDKSFEQFQSDIIDVLKKLDSNPKDKKAYEATVRGELYKIVDKYSENLRPDTGSKTYVSPDKTFVLVISANGKKEAGGGEKAVAIDNDAKIVVAIAGDGIPYVKDTNNSGGGGAAIAQGKKGVAIAIAGRGGNGGGGGGGAVGLGGIGGLGMGGEGGAAIAGVVGRGGDGQGSGIQNAQAIIDALKTP